MAADKLTLERIAFMHPKVRDEVYQMYSEANNKLLGKNVRLRFAYTLRTNAEQDALYAQGRTVLFDKAGKRLGKVTNAKGGQSIHNYGLAFDIVILIDKNGDGIFETASWDVKADNDGNKRSDWMAVTEFFKSKGWTWGGDWKGMVDPPHFEKTFGHTWKTLQSKVNAGKVTKEEIAGKIYKYADI